MSWLCGILGRSTPLVREAGSAVCAGKTGQPGVRSLFPMSKVHVTVSATPGLWDVWRPVGGEPSLPRRLRAAPSHPATCRLCLPVPGVGSRSPGRRRQQTDHCFGC